MDLTRTDVGAYVGTAFIGGGASRSDLVALARAAHAPVEVLHLLRTLPERRFGRLCEVWDCLPDLPATDASTASRWEVLRAA